MNCPIFWPETYECSGNGQCINGKCVCNIDWSGYGDFVYREEIDCSINKKQRRLISILLIIPLIAKLLYNLSSITSGFKDYCRKFNMVEPIIIKKGKNNEKNGIDYGGGTMIKTDKKFESCMMLHVDDHRVYIDTINDKVIPRSGDEMIKKTLEGTMFSEDKVPYTIATNKSKQQKQNHRLKFKRSSRKTMIFILSSFFKLKVRAQLDSLCIMDAGFMLLCECSKLLGGQYVGHDMFATTCYALSAACFLSFCVMFLINWVRAAVSSDISLRLQLRYLLKKLKLSLLVVIMIVYFGCFSLISTPIFVQNGDITAFDAHMMVYHVVIALGLLILNSYLVYFGLKLIGLIHESSRKLPLNKSTCVTFNSPKVAVASSKHRGVVGKVVAVSSPAMIAKSHINTDHIGYSNSVLSTQAQAITQQKKQHIKLMKKLISFICLVEFFGVNGINTAVAVLIWPWLWNRSMIFIGLIQAVSGIGVAVVGSMQISYKQTSVNAP